PCAMSSESSTWQNRCDCFPFWELRRCFLPARSPVHRIRTRSFQSALPHSSGLIILTLDIYLKKEDAMSNSQENRVLGRTGARLVTEEELQAIKGGVQTFVCSVNPLTVARDGDAC